MTSEQLAILSGTNNLKNTPAGGGYYDTITLAKDGNFYLAHYSEPKATRPDPTKLGTDFAMTIIKLRFKQSLWQDKVQVLESVEYDAGATGIPTTQGTMTEAEAKAKGAKKALIAYGLYEGKMVKMTVSGGSLYNPDDTEDLRLYSYLQDFGDDEHIFMYETVVSSKENTYEFGGETKTNYQMTFAKSVNSDIEAVGVALPLLVADLVENDKRDLRFLKHTSPSQKNVVEDSEPF